MDRAVTANLNVPIDEGLMNRAEELFEELGMSLPTAINVFIRQSLREGVFQFDITACKPKKETVMAMLEAERIVKDPSVKGYTELFRDLDDEY